MKVSGCRCSKPCSAAPGDRLARPRAARSGRRRRRGGGRRRRIWPRPCSRALTQPERAPSGERRRCAGAATSPGSARRGSPTRSMRRRGGDSAGERPRTVPAPEAPYPLAGGGALRSASLLEYLARRYAVDVVVFREPGAPDPRQSFPPAWSRRICVLDLPSTSRRCGRTRWRNARAPGSPGSPPCGPLLGFRRASRAVYSPGSRYEVAVVEHFWCAPYSSRRPRRPRARCSTCTISSRSCTGRCGSAGTARRRRWCTACSRAPRWRWSASGCRAIACLLAASEPDAGRARRIAPGASVLVYPNALPAAAVAPCAEEHAMAFSGQPRISPEPASAVRFFARDIWPALRARRPGLVWRLVGRNAHGGAPVRGAGDRVSSSAVRWTTPSRHWRGPRWRWCRCSPAAARA